MKIKKFLFLTLLLTIAFTCKKVYAFDVNDYRYKGLCGSYEVAGFHEDGYIDPVACFGTFEEAKSFMKSNGAYDLGILHNVNGENKILDANMALLDLSVNPTQLTYFYENSELTSRQYTYMDTGSLYGGVDAGFLDSGWSNAKGKWVAKVRIGNFTGWIPQEAYEVVPISWLRSFSHYTVTNDVIRHNYVTKIQNDYRSSGGNTIGPKPEMLNPGVYYSYDGHYFYNEIEQLILDYKNDTYANAVNKNNPYYNYYMYLSNHTRTAYSSVNIDEYIRNMGYTKDVYGHKASDGTSRLYGSGTFFYYAQEKYGVNAILSLSLSRNETGNGRSYLAINKNNGFGLNAVDSDPINGASWYATFGSSILGYASKWITYGFAHPRDWRYFGPQFGDKWIGMNVKYASDTYWSEKMAANYFSLDRAFGMQDYNYYQLGVLRQAANAYSGPSTSSKWIYQYPEAEDAVVIVGEVKNGNETWYKVVSDLNIDENFNEITSGPYNWNSYVYVKADYIKKINTGKNGYITPNEVTEYQNSHYEYDLYVSGTTFQPRVGVSTKNTDYYYDSSLTSAKGQVLLKDRYVIVYAVAKLNNQPVSYLVTSDYYYAQKEWVPADSIRLTNTPYGKVTVDTDDNQYTWVNYNTEDAAYSLIGGLYTYSYVPILESLNVNGETWYKVPVSLSTDNNVYGYTLAKYSNYIWIDLSSPVVEHHAPTITASDKTIDEGATFDPKKDVTAYDQEDGDLTSKIQVTENTVNTATPGTYKVTYKVVDNDNQEVTKTITITVKENKPPVITASNKTVTINTTFDPKKDVTANDPEDGDLTSKITIKENTVKLDTLGTYKVVYEVQDTKGKKTTKEIQVEVVKDREPIINASNKTIVVNNTFDPLEGVTATDPEDGDITSKIQVTKNTIKTNTVGKYEVTYEVTDTSSNKVTKTIQVEVIGSYIEQQGEFYLESLTWDASKKKFLISGYEIVLNQNNTNKKYYVTLSNKNTSSSYRVQIDSWTKDVPYDLGEENGFSYSDSWFKGYINLDNLPNGDYELQMAAYTGNYYASETITNLFNKSIDKRKEDDSHGYNFKVLNNYKVKPIELEIRDELYTTSTAPTFRKMINEFEEIKFQNDKLFIEGYSFNYGGTYNTQANITRKLILENVDTFAQKTYDLGSKVGPYSLDVKDKLDKTYIWYEKEIDLTSLPKGTYSVLVYTKTSNAEDYGELSDMFKTLNKQTTIGDKTYIIKCNTSRQNRLEITIK